MKNEAIPFYRPGQDITCKAAAALIGRRLCIISGNRTGGPGLSTDLQNVYQVNYPVAAGRVFGVVGWDVAINELVPVKFEGVLPVEVIATVVAWQEVETDNVGRVLPYAAGAGHHPVGVALTGAAGGAFAEIRLYRAGTVV